jgi:hypothetical protein
MASLEDLPADQRAVLQMVLTRGRTYDQIAATLSIDREAVRRRAIDACDALTPEGIKPGSEQPLVTDYLLSQLSEQVAADVHAHLESAPEDRDWARAIATRLQRLAAGPLPDVPVAAPLRSDQLAPARRPESPPPAHTEVERPDRADREPQRLPFAPTARRRPSARVLAALGVAATIVVVGAVLLANRGTSSSPGPGRIHTQSSAGTITAGTTTATTAPQLLAALNLTSPTGDKQALGVADVVRDNGVVGIAIDAQGVPPNSAHNAYGLWLYNSAKSHEFVGFDPNLVGANGKLALEGKLPTDASHFRRLLITLETQQHPKTPGEVVLSGPFREN